MDNLYFFVCNNFKKKLFTNYLIFTYQNKSKIIKILKRYEQENFYLLIDIYYIYTKNEN